MAGYLLTLILVGSTLHAATSEEKKQKDGDVKYEGPVVYTNLPPPVLYFPSFPEKDKISNRGSSGDVEDKRIEYVPFPYKDLPLLVYKSDKQPPVHVVEKRSNQDADSTNSIKSSAGVGYQTGPAVYRTASNGQFSTEPADQNGSGSNGGITNPVAAQSQQYISIGVSSVQQQDQQLQAQNAPQQQTAYYNQVQYSESQSEDQGQYDPNGSQTGPSYDYYPSQQYSPQVPESQVQQPSFQLPQGIQNYMYQSSQDQQHVQPIQQSLPSYSDKQVESMSSEVAPMQHVGITIIRPGVSDVADSSQSGQQVGYQQGGYQQPVQMVQPQSQGSGEMGYGENPQYVSIGVFPIPDTPDDYGQDTPQYYSEVSQDPNSQYQVSSEEYRPTFATSGMEQNHNPETPNYQLISIDLSTLRNQQAKQQNSYAGPSQQAYQSMSPAPQHTVQPPQEMYSMKNQNSQSYANGEKGIQQIVIQIPQNIVSESPQKPPSQTSHQPERPYRGTAQVANVARPQNKMPPAPPAYRKPMYNRPPPPPPGPQFGFPPAGINIAIIKQSDTVNVPQYRPPERIPHPAQSNRMPMYHSRPPVSHFPPHAHAPPQRPYSRPRPFNSQGFHRDHDMPASASTFRPSNTRHPPTSFRQHRSRPVPPPPPRPQQGPEFHQSSNVHYSSAPPTMVKPPFRGQPMRQLPAQFAHASASMIHPQFMPLTGGMPFSPDFSESALHAITNNVTDELDDVNFDYINAFLDPNYDFYGMAQNHGHDPKKEEEKLIQKLTSELMLQDLNIATNQLAAGMQPIQPLVGVLPPYGMVQPHPGMINAPFPYRYWEQQPVSGVGPHKIRGGIFAPYSQFQHPYMQGNRPFGRFGRGRRKHGFGKGVRGLKGRLASLRSSIRQKKIAPRQETTDEGTETDLQKIDQESATMNAAPRSTIVQTDGPGLDGIPIPLNPDHVLSSRMSTVEGVKEKPDKMPPIIVYEGTKPPYEIYGTQEDIEGTKKNGTAREDSSKVTDADIIKDLMSEESRISYAEDSSGYFNYMYSMLPELIRDTLGRRHDGTGEKWAPGSPLEYALAEDQYDRNDTSTPQIVSTIELETIPVSKNSSAPSNPSLEAMIAETFSLLTKEEMSDIL